MWQRERKAPEEDGVRRAGKSVGKQRVRVLAGNHLLADLLTEEDPSKQASRQESKQARKKKRNDVLGS